MNGVLCFHQSEYLKDNTGEYFPGAWQKTDSQLYRRLRIMCNLAGKRKVAAFTAIEHLAFTRVLCELERRERLLWDIPTDETGYVNEELRQYRGFYDMRDMYADWCSHYQLTPVKFHKLNKRWKRETVERKFNLQMLIFPIKLDGVAW